ncbi:MAG: hypothetical protein OHK0031_00460 [Anaerolineales bacterium]
MYNPAMPILRVPALLTYYLDGQNGIPLQGATVAAALRELGERHPKLTPQIFDSAGKLRRHINLFVNAENIRALNGLETPLAESDILKIVPSVTGG